MLHESSGLPVVVDNDVNALCLAEWRFGQAKGLRHVAMIAVGAGVGGGLILNGSLVRGANGYAGEIGHITVEMDGRPCFCGSRGCVKAYASGPDLVAQVRELLEQAPSSIWSELTAGDPGRIEPSLIFRAADRGVYSLVDGLAGGALIQLLIVLVPLPVVFRTVRITGFTTRPMRFISIRTWACS